jgi:LacI family transcriptional regulator
MSECHFSDINVLTVTHHFYAEVIVIATIRDVAKLANVSVATVSRYLNQNGYISKDAEDRIKDAVGKLNYSPNTMARGLAGYKTNTIALIVSEISNPFFSALAKAVEDTATKLGYTTLLANSDRNSLKEIRYIEALKKRHVDGIIFATQMLATNEINELLGAKIPIVSIDRASSEQAVHNISMLQVNHYKGAVMAVEHLLSVGCKNIAHISGPGIVIPAKDRLQGYIDTLTRYGRFTPSYIVEGDFTMESGFKLTQDLLARHPEIDGIFATIDLMAIGSLKALLRAGRKVPDDVALIGFDGIEMTGLTEPEISTIAQPIYEMGEQAVYQLIHQIEDKSSPIQLKQLDVKLLARSSTTGLP